MSMLRIGVVLASLLGLAGLAQDGEFCSKFNKCHTEHDKEKIKCPKCEKTLIPKNDALCAACANKEKVCMHCGKPKEGSAPVKKAGKCKDIEEAIQNIKADDMRKLLMHVAGDEMMGRCAGSPEHTKLTGEFADIYKKAGLKPGNGGNYFQDCDVGGKASRNVVAILEGEKKDEWVIYGAHSDHIGTVGNGPPRQQLGGAVGGDNIFNGADDNGSGTVSVLTIARVLAESGLKPKRSILFLNWTGEEWGLIGSKFHAGHLPFPKEQLVAAVDTDMLGRYAGHGSVEIYGLGTEVGDDWEQICQKNCDKLGIKCTLHQESKVAGGDSDHSSYRNIGIPDMFWFTGIHADYHKVTDSVEKIDFAGMEKIVRAFTLTLWYFANTDKRWQFQNN